MTTCKRDLPHYQVAFKNNKGRAFYILVQNNYPEHETYLIKRTACGFSCSKVETMTNVSFIPAIGYHHDYMTGEEVNFIEEKICEIYSVQVIVEQLKPADDIPF